MGIYSFLTLLVGAEAKWGGRRGGFSGKHSTARVWLQENTARLAEAAPAELSWPTFWACPVIIIIRIYGTRPNPDNEAHPNRKKAKEGGEMEMLIRHKWQRAGPAWSNKIIKKPTKLTWSGLNGGREGKGWATLEWCCWLRQSNLNGIFRNVINKSTSLQKRRINYENTSQSASNKKKQQLKQQSSSYFCQIFSNITLIFVSLLCGTKKNINWLQSISNASQRKTLHVQFGGCVCLSFVSKC